MQNESGYGGISMTEYLSILFVDCGYHESSQRRGWLQKRFGKSYADELTPAEAYKAVQEMRPEKYGDDIE